METTAAIERFDQLVSGMNESVNTAECALTAVAAFGMKIDIEAELVRLNDLAEGARASVETAETPLGQINALNYHLFDDLRFSGNVQDYYDPRNSLLDSVLERRLGIPITLSLLYIEIGGRLGVTLAGVGMPGHFLVRHANEDGLYIDPFNRGVILNASECRNQFERINKGIRWDPAFLTAISARALLARLLRNLAAIWTQSDDLVLAERVMTLLISLQPDEAGHHRDRGMLRFKQGHKHEALEDLKRYVEPVANAPDAWYVRRIINRISDTGN